MNEETQSTVEIDRTLETPAAEIGGHKIDRTPREIVRRPPSIGWIFLLALVVVAADQMSKWWVRFNIEPGQTRDFWPGVLHLSHVWNWGAAWGVFAGARWPLIFASLAVIIGIVFCAKRIAASGRPALWAAGLILGGAIGNLIDRVQFGYVLDMIDMDTPLNIVRNFPVFNLADSALTLGVILLLLMSLWPASKVESKSGK